MKRILVLLAASSLAAPVLAKGNVAAGETKAKAVCAACHGADGSTPTTPDFPYIGGQYYDYLVRALNDYKTGARKNAIMAGMAKPLTDQEIQDLAAYFAAQPGKLGTKR
jgi:cytochrome c553